MCEAAREDTLPDVPLLNPSLAPSSPCLCRPSPSPFVHSLAEQAEALRGFSRAWPNWRETSQGLGFHPSSPPVAGAWCVKAVTHKSHRGLREKLGQAHAWGCQGREKGLGLNGNKLPECSNFIPLLLWSAIQSLLCFYAAETPGFFPVADGIAAESVNSLRVFCTGWCCIALKAVEGLLPGFGSTRVMLWLLQLLFPHKSCTPCLRESSISFHSTLGGYILEVFKANECKKCNLSLSTKK